MTKTEISERLQRTLTTLTNLINKDLSITSLNMSKLDSAETYRLLKIDTDAHNLATDITSLITILQPKDDERKYV